MVLGSEVVIRNRGEVAQEGQWACACSRDRVSNPFRASARTSTVKRHSNDKSRNLAEGSLHSIKLLY